MEKHNLCYSIFVGDGDSDTFGFVKEKLATQFGGSYPLTKEECQGHIQKRMGHPCREFKRKKKGMKLSDGKTVGGVNRLTDKIIQKFQNYYGLAIRRNTTLQGMQDAIWAVFDHLIRDDSKILQEQHDKCPKDADYHQYFVRR